MTSDFDRDFAARLHTVLDAEMGPHATWTDSPAVQTLGRRRRRHFGSIRLLGVAAVLLIGGAVVGGVLLGQIRTPTGPPSNGRIAYAADQIRLVGDGAASNAIIGAADDMFIDDCPAYSPDGSKLAYTELDLRFVVPTEAPRPSIPDGEPTPEPTVRPTPRPTPEPGTSMLRLLVVDVAKDGRPTGAPIEVAAGDDFSCPRWSPDGTRLAAISGSTALFTVDMAGNRTQLGPSLQHPDLSNHTDFDWSPDGTTIAVSDSETSWLVPADGGTPRSLPEKPWLLRWSPDGRHLAADVGPDVVLLTPDGSVVATLVDRNGEGPAGPWAWSPDGRWLAYVDGTKVVQVAADGSGHEPDAIAIPSADGQDAGVRTWSPAGDRILVTLGGGFREPVSLIAVPVDPQATPVVLLGPDDRYFGGATSWQPRYD